MSYEGLASRMVGVGCPINASAIYKIEKADPPRRITVDELIGFSKVLNIQIEELLLPPEVVASQELRTFVTAFDAAREEADAANAKAGEAQKRLRAFLADHPELVTSLEQQTKAWVEQWVDEESRRG